MNVDVYSYYGYEQYMAELEQEDVFCPHCGEKIYDGCQSVATGEWYCSEECREEADDIYYEKEMELWEQVKNNSQEREKRMNFANLTRN